MVVCNTTNGSLVWETSSAQGTNWEYDVNLQRLSPVTLGNFTLSRDGANATAVNSTAVLTDPVQLLHDNVTLRCSENSPDLSDFREIFLSVGKSLNNIIPIL